MAYEKHIIPTATAPAQVAGGGGFFIPAGDKDAGAPPGDGDGNGDGGSRAPGGGSFWSRFQDWLFGGSENPTGLDKLLNRLFGGSWGGGGSGSGGMDATSIAMIGGVLLLILIIVFGVVLAWKRT